MKIITVKDAIPLFVIALMIIAGIVLLMSPCVADKLPTHWNAQGQVDGWGSKTFVALFYPLLTLGIWALMVFLPYFDPFRKNYDKFATPYFYLRLIIIVFLAAISNCL